MLSRTAESLYWLARYVERAEYLARTIEATLIDPTWATPTTRSTGYAFAAIFYFLCCWGMSRYSIAVVERLAAGQKR